MARKLAEYLLAGIVIKPQGIKGELKVKTYTDDSEGFCGISCLFWENGGTYTPVNVRTARAAGVYAYISIEGVQDRSAAEALRGCELFVDRAHAPEPPEGTYYIVDIVGCEVVDEEGAAYGNVSEVLPSPANDVYVIKHGGREWMLPALKSIIAEYDIEHARLITRKEALLEFLDAD